MPDKFTVQCQSCGTLYHSSEDVCPYCGEPQPLESGYDDDEMLLVEDMAVPDYEAAPEEDLYEETVLSAGAYPQEPYEEDYPPDETVYPAGYPVEDEAQLPETYSAEVYAVEDYYAPETAYYAGQAGLYDSPDEEELLDDDLNEAEEATLHRSLWPRLLVGCLGAFICVSLLYGGIGVLAAYHGIQERAQEMQSEAEVHYQRGQTHLANNALELAVAEFEQALRLNPNLLQAREALRETQRIAQSQPTPTSETRSAAAAELFEQAQTEIAGEDWPAAIETLSQVRDLDPEYEKAQVSQLVYQANYQQGLQLINPDQIGEALLYLERALAEAPDDKVVKLEAAKASLYLEGVTALIESDASRAVNALSQLYREADDYLDVGDQLRQAYELYGDELAAGDEWCLAEAQYIEAAELVSNESVLANKLEVSQERCAETSTAQVTGVPTPRSAAPPAQAAANNTSTSDATGSSTGTPSDETEAAPSTGAGGTLFYSMYNASETQWEIRSAPAGGGTPQTVVTDGTMPAVSPNGQWLVYRSEAIESEGFHIYDLTTGEDRRITIVRQHMLPRWGGDNSQFLFSAQEPATGRWLVYVGYADGKGDPQILRDGRTPAWSPDNQLIAYQGTDPEGNNPGIYVVPFGGGTEARLTTHESDRSPAFAPNGSQLAYMSTQNGSWDIYTVSLNGGSPRQLTTTGSNDGLPVWSPDGSKIAYVSDSGGSWGIYVVNAGGGAPTKVTGWDGNNHPDWLLAQIWWAR